MTDKNETDIGDVYEETKRRGAGAIYADWAKSYDSDNAALGFRLPAMASAFAARHIPAGAAPILDAGCGTGLVGGCLAILGYEEVVGIDLSEEMLAVAERSGAYAGLKRQVLGEPLDFAEASFAGVLCIGSFGPGHAPPETLEELARVARKGAPVIFNVIERFWRDQGFPAVIDRLTEQGRWRLKEERGGWRPYTIGEPDLLTRLFVFEAI